MLKILHTSDWHLGRSLYDKKRHDEIELFLTWLLQFIESEKIDILLVAGDIFDSTTPGNRSQEIYYGFLAGIRETACRHVIITGGNHDSPTFLNAPKDLLGALHINVVGAITGKYKDEIFPVSDQKGNLQAIICAVPFLHDRDIRTVEPGETPDDKSRKMKENIAGHYKEVYSEAIKLQNGKNKVPLIAMGHLFTREARTSEGDGVRELYIGTTAHIDEKDISAGFDYMALGHLHQTQIAGGNEKVRYSGSPIPMGFSEAGQKKKVIVAIFNEGLLSITEHDVPCFRELIRIEGDLEQISAMIEHLNRENRKAWIEIEVTSQADAAVINARLHELQEKSQLEILRIKNRSITTRTIENISETETLEMLDDRDVFKRCLEANEVPAEDHETLLGIYDEAVRTMQSLDVNAE